jgi:hypothetical protein
MNLRVTVKCPAGVPAGSPEAVKYAERAHELIPGRPEATDTPGLAAGPEYWHQPWPDVATRGGKSAGHP